MGGAKHDRREKEKVEAIENGDRKPGIHASLNKHKRHAYS